MDCYFIAKSNSISTGELSGNDATPTADRECDPKSPKIFNKSCDALFAIFAWSEKVSTAFR